MNFSISIRTLFAMAAFFAAYALSYWLFWDDQMKLSSFHLNPKQSIVTRYLVQSVPWGMRGEARLFGTILAFVSLHLSWGYRYWLGDRLMQLVGAYLRRKTVIGSKVIGGNDDIQADASFHNNDREIPHENTQKRLSSDD